MAHLLLAWKQLDRTTVSLRECDVLPRYHLSSPSGRPFAGVQSMGEERFAASFLCPLVVVLLVPELLNDLSLIHQLLLLALP